MELSFEIGLTFEQFYRMNWKEFQICVQGYRNRQTEEWRRVREILFAIDRHSMNPNKNVKRPEDIIQLPGDKKTKGLTKEEKELALRALKNGKS